MAMDIKLVMQRTMRFYWIVVLLVFGELTRLYVDAVVVNSNTRNREFDHQSLENNDNCDATPVIANGESKRVLLTAQEVEQLCDVPEFDTCEDFAAKYWNKAPAVLRRRPPMMTKGFRHFQDLSNKTELLKNSLRIKLSTSVSYTGRIFTEQTVAEYVKDETPASKLGNETYYLFGNHEGQDWQDFLAGYPRLELSPWFSCLGLNPADAALSFGCAKNGTGVPWHFHGPGFLQVLVGSKMWFLTPYEITNDQIRFDPNITTKGWYEDEFLKDVRLQKLVTTCVLQEGDVIYFPPMWRHATYNTEWSSWMSTFLP